MKCTCTTGLDQFRSTIEIKTCSLCKAAPDLLEACKQLTDILEDHEDAEVCSHANSLTMGRAAIDKAEGRGK